MYTMTRYADLSGELNEILKEIWKILEGFCYLTFSWYLVSGFFLRGFMSEYPLTL